MPEKKSSSKTIRLKLTAHLLESREAEMPKAVAYAFSSGGRLLGRETLDAKGTATLTLRAASEARDVRVIVGPATEEKAQIEEILRRGGVENHVRIDPRDLNPTAEIQIIPDVWRCWLLSRCFVRGKLLKRVITGGVPVDLPVCDATVEVYEVDPIHILIPKLPDLIIDRIRDFIINPPPPPPPPIDELPFPLIGPRGPIPPPPPGPGPSLERHAMSPSEASGGMATGEAAGRSVSIAGDLQFLARTASTAQLRQVFVDYAPTIRHILCMFFPPLVSMQLVATATTDRCGHFQTVFFPGCVNHDTPDLYFKAKQRLFGFFDVTIYAPTPVACFTYWDYICGTEVTLHTNHPLAMTCAPCPPVVAPDNWVLVMAVGNFPLSRIRGTGTSLQATTTPANIGLTDGDAPFGGLLRLRIEFDNALRDDLGVRYYRVSYRKGTTGAFLPLTGEAHRHYTHKVGTDLVLEVLPLGPLGPASTPPAPAPNLFEIPPALPPLGQWSFPDLLEDLTSAKFPTNDLAPFAARGVAWPEHGKYQIKLDLFTTAGAPVNIATLGINYRVPTSTDLSGTIQTADAASLGLIDGNSFIMTLHLDNSLCLATIAAPSLGGTLAGDECGVLEYTTPKATAGSVAMPFIALHPHGFADYSFRVFRGANELTLPPAPASATLPATGQAAPPGGFSNIQSVAHLLGNCSIAGFSENLYVAATAYDGWSRLSGYDASAVRAFVLAPETA